MKETSFVDTGYWLALFNKKDNNHLHAKNSLYILMDSDIFITDFIMFETITFLNASLKNSQLTRIFVDFVYNKNNRIEILVADENIKIEALQLLLKYDDKYFSFTDCTSFIILKKYNIDNVFTFDYHFQQMGFSVL